MNPRSRGRSPVPSRVARKLADTDTAGNVFCIPYRPRNDAAYLRKTAAADIVVTTQSQRYQTDSTDRDPRPLAAADALSLSGSTPPSSPTMSSFPGGPKVIMSDVNEMTTSNRSQLVLIDSQGNVAVNDRDDSSPVDGSAAAKDLPFRRHNRGIGSIDSILSSTTCVNTHSECSRAESRLSREIRIEIEDLDGGARLASHQTGANMYAGADYSTSILEDAYPHRNIQLGLPSAARPGSSLTCRDLEEYGELDEERLIDEISSWVLRNTCGKDVDDCALPLLIWDCTYRYVQELWSAAHEGSLGIVQASGHGTPGSQGGGGSPGEGGSEQQSSGYFGKGKRKAEGGSEDGGGLGGDRDNMGDEDGDTFMGLQGYSSNKSSITNYSCPYRKRNPLRFNVREHYVCATHSFSDMSQLKKHIRAHHPPVQRNAGPFLCPRCCQGFPSKSDLDCHLRQLTVCRLSDDHGGADPEDGITQKIISSLEARSLKAKIDNWVSLWKLLFPHDSTIPEPVFIPVMEVFDFIAESRKFVATLKDLLELQYRHVLEGATQAVDVELKIRQGLERSTQSIYTWIETVMQDWEQRICGTVSFFSPSSVERTVAASDVSESWPPSAQLLPPSPASTPTVVSGNLMSTVPGGAESPVSAGAPAARVTSAVARRRPNPPPKRIKREALPKIQPSTQIPVPIQRARTPQLSSRASTDSFRASRPAVLPSQAVLIPASSAPHPESAPAYPQPSWDSPAVTVPDAYTIPYTTAGEMFQTPIPAPTHYSPVTHSHNQLEAQSYLPHDHPQLSPDAVHVPTTEALQQRDMSGRPQSNISTSTISTVRASRLMTPRSSIASNWIRDENRDSSQTLVEAHPPGRCQNMYCPSCSKALPDDVGVTITVPSPVGMHHGIGVGGHPQQQHLHQHQHQHQQHHGVFHTGAAFPAVTAPGDVHNFVGEQVEWGFQQGGGAHHDNMFGGHGGPQEGY